MTVKKMILVSFKKKSLFWILDIIAKEETAGIFKIFKNLIT